MKVVEYSSYSIDLLMSVDRNLLPPTPVLADEFPALNEEEDHDGGGRKNNTSCQQ